VNPLSANRGLPFGVRSPNRGLDPKVSIELACSKLSVSEEDRKSERATSGISGERDPGKKRRPARHAPAISIVRTDKEPGTGYN